jgi:hypothetical protein
VFLTENLTQIKLKLRLYTYRLRYITIFIVKCFDLGELVSVRDRFKNATGISYQLSVQTVDTILSKH